MNVRRSAPVPDERGSLQTPVIPDAVLAEIVRLVEGQVTPVESALALERLDHFIAVRLAVWLDEQLQYLLDVFLLVLRQLSDRNALELAFRPAESDLSFVRRVGPQREFALLAVEHLVHLVGGFRLVPEDVAGVIVLLEVAAGGMPVDDRTAEGDVVRRVAVAANRAVPSAQDELELAAARSPEQRDGLLHGASAHVVLELLVEARHPVGADQPLEDVADHFLLIRGEKAALDGRFGDAPVVRDVSPQQATPLVLV